MGLTRCIFEEEVMNNLVEIDGRWFFFSDVNSLVAWMYADEMQIVG